MSIGRTNSGSGGGVSGAIVRVIAATGSTISFSKGGVVAKVLPPEKSHESAEAANSSEYYYTIGKSNFGEWSITASKDGEQLTTAVTVNAEKLYLVHLYRVYLFKAGVGIIGNSITSSRQDNAQVSINSDRIKVTYSGSGSYCSRVATVAKIDMTPYSKVIFDIYVTSAPQNDYRPRYLITDNNWIQGGPYTTDSYVVRKMMAVGARQNVSVDIINVNSEKYISVSGVWAGEIYNIYLER